LGGDNVQEKEIGKGRGRAGGIFDVSPMVNIDREKMMAQYATIERLGISSEKCARNKPVIPVSGLPM
jgi:hypothetical protein